MADEYDICQKFNELTVKFYTLLHGRSDKQQQYITSLLDDLNALNYKLPLITDINKAVLIIHEICIIVPPGNIEVATKCCVLITNLVTKQKITIEKRTLFCAVDWIIQIIKSSEKPNVSIFQCLECLIRDNVDKIQDLLPELIGTKGILLHFAKNSYSQNVHLWTVKCLEAIIFYSEEQNFKISEINNNYLKSCAEIFVMLLSEEKQSNYDVVTYCKLLISCLRGLQSIIMHTNSVENFDLGIYLGIARSYMTYYLYESEWIPPQKIMPSNLSVADLKINSREKKGGKITKQRKQRKYNAHKKEDSKRSDNTENCYTPAVSIPDCSLIVISDSDFSDSETGKNNKISLSQGRVRQAALNMLLCIIKVTDKHIIFGYWSSFFSDGSSGSIQNLNRCLLQESSVRGQIAILNVMSFLLGGAKFYLSQAEISIKSVSFTPFSMVLGTMIQELHRCLCAALKNNTIPVITQTLKCLALLVQSTPYHRLSSGLIDGVITQVKPFIRHKDTRVQVAALIVLGCIVASEPVTEEAKNNLTQNTVHIKNEPSSVPQTEPNQEIEYAEFSSDDEDELRTFETNSNISWLLEKCLRNLGVISTGNKNVNTVPAPVKLESLQVISAMCRNYFYLLLVPHIMLIAKAFEISLNDKYMDLRLHAARAIDSVGHAMQQSSSTGESKSISVDLGLSFWQNLLNGPLIALLHTEQNASLRSVGCDCLGSIGSDIFEHLPKDKQLLIITSLFSCSRDEENSVKGAAVRALAICALYPSLREDLGFVMDTTEAIKRTLTDNNLTVRIKSSWALGNLSETLVLYKNNPTNEDLPDTLIRDLLLSCMKVVNDNNKIKSNIVRALGNLLRLVTEILLQRDQFKDITEQAVCVLLKNCTNSSDMKVRWNSCYAIGNFMKNNDLFTYNADWQEKVYPVLMDLVVNIRNFKVRINAALALSVPEKRSHYKNFYFSIWKSLLKALDNSQNMEDFNEFKHRDNLIDQICLSISHLTMFLTLEDLHILNELLVHHIDTLKNHLHRVQERLVPEKSENVLKALNHINNLKLGQLTTDQKSLLALLENIFARNYSL